MQTVAKYFFISVSEICPKKIKKYISLTADHNSLKDTDIIYSGECVYTGPELGLILKGF